ncbi:hypothetical protein EIN_075380 [Entamoeba invadens IP1]|uniref:Leucine rich repeat containing protein BspA family protein n=1 Tax=Entamoeba invadens IP1 TaxID=370355 RepID=A0A0A1U1J5_ENTIV|nr:hypothetical protein EIN_075380 [Entamoeba invadens IP1]ELP84779.1 hypothetical protein EIN_075380 [Entamoeba invadens IP1]|eukprot:XP_004184125.1 hypothetical protein EIN_075380 [Entamoeba invadens IP1]
MISTVFILLYILINSSIATCKLEYDNNNCVFISNQIDCEGELIIPNTTSCAGNQAFYNTNLRKITFESESKIKIMSNAFQSSNKLEEIIAPGGFESVGVGAFKDCISLKTIVGYQNTTVFGKNCFQNCLSLHNFTFNEQMMFDEYAFAGSGLISIDLTHIQMSISTYFCSNCVNLHYVNLGSNQVINSYAFANCSSLSQVDTINGLKIVNTSAFMNDPIISIRIADDAEQLFSCAFSGTKLRNLKLPNKSIILEDSVF